MRLFKTLSFSTAFGIGALLFSANATEPPQQPAHPLCSSQFSSLSQHTLHSFSEITKKNGFRSLQHSTPFENVIEILTSGRMELPRNLPKSSLRSFNYTPDLVMFNLISDMNVLEEGFLYASRFTRLDILNKEIFPEGAGRSDLNTVYLQFSLEAMDGRDFHISSQSQNYGRFKSGVDFRSTAPKPSLEEFYSRQEVGEVGFHETVPTRYLTEIWVSPGRRDELLERLRQTGISEINGIEIDKFVKSPSPSTFTYIDLQNLHQLSLPSSVKKAIEESLREAAEYPGPKRKTWVIWPERPQ